MASLVLVIALTAFLGGAATAVFFMLFIGIRKGDRPERILESRSSSLDACTRSVIGSGTWPNLPVYRSNREDDQSR
jgi:hypothetical protein